MKSTKHILPLGFLTCKDALEGTRSLCWSLSRGARGGVYQAIHGGAFWRCFSPHPSSTCLFIMAVWPPRHALLVLCFSSQCLLLCLLAFPLLLPFLTVFTWYSSQASYCVSIRPLSRPFQFCGNIYSPAQQPRALDFREERLMVLSLLQEICI